MTRQFNAMAERLERDDAERRVMLAGLPHDLRAPLSRARLRLELMDDGPDSPKRGLQRDLTEVGRIADQFVAYLRGLDHDRQRLSRRSRCTSSCAIAASCGASRATTSRSSAPTRSRATPTPTR